MFPERKIHIDSPAGHLQKREIGYNRRVYTAEMGTAHGVMARSEPEYANVDYFNFMLV